MEHLLEVTDLSTEFSTRAGTVRAVKDVSFHVSRGETLAVVGESGSGKSVTSLSIMRLIKAPAGRIVAGQVVFDGTDLLGLSEKQMQSVRGHRIAMIFQDPMTSLNPVLTTGRQITEVLRLHLGYSKHQAVERAIELFEMVGIPSPKSRLQDYPHQFSGGMRQRVMIAMALACEPELLIADEPTTALDVTIQAQILELIRDLQQRLGMAVMIVSHDLGVVAGIADRVQVVYGGRIVEEGVTAEVFADPRMPYTMGLLRSIPRLNEHTERLFAISGRPATPQEAERGCAFVTRCPFAQNVCRTEVPPLRSVGGTHRTACHFDLTMADHTNLTEQQLSSPAAV